jgi:O-antigen ligase
MKKNLERVAKILIFATFFVPLIVLPSSYIFPFIVPKILWFRSLVALMIGAYILLLFVNWQEYKPKLTALNLALLAFLLSFAASTFAGTDWYHSFWDNHERMLGLFTIFHYIAFYFVASAVFKSWSDWKWALRIFLFAGSIVMFIGVLQKGDPTLLLNQGSDRVASTLGNSIYVGGYGLFLMFVAYLLAIKEKNSVWRWAEILLGALAFLGMFFSGTRGSLLGLVAGVGALILGYMVVLKEYPRTRLALLVLAGVGVLTIVLLYSFRGTDFVKNIPAVGRAANTSLSDVEGSARWIAWEIAVQSWKDRPVFGWGPNNYFYAFNAHYNPRSLEFGYGETWFDNAHNIIVNTLAVQGAVGLLTYLAIFGLGISSLIVARRKNKLELHIAVVGSAFLVAHLVGNITVFENPTSYLYFMIWLAMVNSLSARSEEQKKEPAAFVPDKKIGYGTIGTTGAICLLFIFVFNIQPSRANQMTLGALKALYANPVTGILEMKSALSFASPHIDDIRSDIGRTVGQLLTQDNIQKMGVDHAKEIFDLAYTNLQKNLILHPFDIRNQLTLAQLGQVGAQLNNSGKYIFESISYLEDALKLSPRRQQIIYSLAGSYSVVGDVDKATKLLANAIDDNPRIGESYWRLAYTYKLIGKIDKAKEIIDLAEKNGIVWDAQGQQVADQVKSITAAK